MTTPNEPNAEARREIVLGKTEANLLNPPNNGIVIEPEHRQRRWRIGRTGSGNIILRPFFSGHQPHEEFLPDGMSLADFVQWINNHLGACCPQCGSTSHPPGCCAKDGHGG